MAITLIGVAMGWVVYQLDWIRQRHQFLAKYGGQRHDPQFDHMQIYPRAPWPLGFFGEHGYGFIGEPESQTVRAHELFPEASL
jgi:hypothetical protein